MMTFFAPASRWPLAFSWGQEQAGGLHNVLSANLAPGQISGVALGEYRDLFAVDNDGILGCFHSALKRTMHGVELEHVGQVIGRAQIVDADDLNVRMIHSGTENHAADAAKTVNTNFDGHNTNTS